MTLLEIVGEPLYVTRWPKGSEIRIESPTFACRRLAPRVHARLPGTFSGGQRQRMAWRALSRSILSHRLRRTVSASTFPSRRKSSICSKSFNRIWSHLFVHLAHLSWSSTLATGGRDVCGQLVEHALTTIVHQPQSPVHRGVAFGVPSPILASGPSRSCCLEKSPIANPPSGCYFPSALPVSNGRCETEEPALRPIARITG